MSCYLLLGSNVILLAKTTIRFISCYNFSGVGIEARLAVHLFNLCSTKCSNMISIIPFISMARMVVELILPPSSSSPGEHWKGEMCKNGQNPLFYCYIPQGHHTHPTRYPAGLVM